MEQTILEFQSVTGATKKRNGFHLKEVSFSLLPGYIYAITGKNGAGKTTLMKCILDERSKYAGTILCHGEDIRNHHAKVMETVGFVSDENTFFEERTARQNAELLSLLYQDFDFELFLQTMKTLKLPASKTYKAMSRGERIKFQLAFAIAHHSTLYLFDEATAGMDPVFRMEFFDLLRALIGDGLKCVLMTSHNETEIIKDTDYAAIMKDGILTPFTESMEGISHDKIR
ncbi:MAG: ABC transporter ATP-binding protein [Lachnospiraceae bacterium]|nr:ABC transporter ATP-binding protein [Lachnospiraceae bacterium]